MKLTLGSDLSNIDILRGGKEELITFLLKPHLLCDYFTP